MPRELLILRHGKSDWGTGVVDFERPLKRKGKRGAQRIGAWLWQNDLRPELVISSPAVRAISTAHKCCKSMGMSTRFVREDQRIYEASLGELLAVLADSPGRHSRVMLVGHNPGLEELLLYLAGAEIPIADDGKLLPTSSLARLTMPEEWSLLHSGCASLERIIRPRALPEGFPFPAPHGGERRDRPAYYYTQSAVIPYLLDEDGVPRFLVIGSSSKRHLVVPKGIKEPGLTPQQSAATEAWEEAGIRGDIIGESLGHYRVKKWGAECSVDVFAMRITEVVAEDEWQESHRMRHWMTAEQAAANLKQPELKNMLLALAANLVE